MIQLEEVSKSFGGEWLFSGLNWQIPSGKSIGLVGPNGAGKTTLFRILVGEEEPDRGRVTRPRDTRVGYLAQEMTVSDEGTLLDVILAGRQDLLDLEELLHTLELQMADGQADQAMTHDYADAQDRFRREGGYELRSTACEIAAGIGFTDADLSEPIATFSGGWKMRALLARLLLSRPDLLLLDEPTNHLDVESIEWLEQFLANYSGTIVTISHDRYFLNRLVGSIAELHAGTITIYQGDYDDYLEERKVRRERLIDEAANQKKEIQRIQDFIDRFRYQASKASQVQSRVKQLEKIDPIEVPPAYDSQINFDFPSPPRVGQIVIDAKDIARRFDDHVVYDGVDFQLNRGQRVALVGPNGAGKSTLLKMLAGKSSPDRGSIELGHQVEVAYFAQHSVDQLDLKNTVLQEMEEAASYEAAPRIRSILGAFLFIGDDVHKQISVLSGGEKSRLALAKLLLEPAGCLLLDEPTNHLDIPSRRVLEHALRNFSGAFCVISHDRYFLNEVVNRVVHIEGGALHDYPGTYEEYRWRRSRDVESGQAAERVSDELDDSAAVSRKEIRRRKAELRKERDGETKKLRKELDGLEKRIQELEVEMEGLEEVLAKPETYEGDGAEIAGLQKRHNEVEVELMEAMSRWEEKGSELEEIENEYSAREAELHLP